MARDAAIVTTWTRDRVISASLPSARTRPSIRITARSQVASTSERMWVERITVLVAPMRRIAQRDERLKTTLKHASRFPERQRRRPLR